MSEEGDKKTGLSMGDLKKMVEETVSAAVSGLKNDKNDKNDNDDDAKKQRREAVSGIDRQVDVRSAVQEALDSLKKEKEKQERETSIDEKLAALEKRTQEKTPVERSKRHRFMGWGEND